MVGLKRARRDEPLQGVQQEIGRKLDRMEPWGEIKAVQYVLHQHVGSDCAMYIYRNIPSGKERCGMDAG